MPKISGFDIALAWFSVIVLMLPIFAATFPDSPLIDYLPGLKAVSFHPFLYPALMLAIFFALVLSKTPSETSRDHVIFISGAVTIVGLGVFLIISAWVGLPTIVLISSILNKNVMLRKDKAG